MNEADYVELGLTCVDVCTALDRGLNGKGLNELTNSVCEAINQLTRWVAATMHGLNTSMTTLLIAGLWQRSKERSSSRLNEMRFPDTSMRRVIKKRSLAGVRT